jgi:hypothetical protein
MLINSVMNTYRRWTVYHNGHPKVFSLSVDKLLVKKSFSIGWFESVFV